MGGTPIWLYDAFGVLLLVVSGYSLLLLGATVGTSRSAGWDVDVAHLLMGVSMAGMFHPSWAFGPNAFWEFVFAALSVWFVSRGIWSIRRYGMHLSHFLIHAVLSLGMFLMYQFPGPANGPSMGMHMAAPMVSGTHLGSGVAFILALTFFASAIFTVGSAQRGVSHHGRHRWMFTGAAPADAENDRRALVDHLVAVSQVEGASDVAMCVAMAFLWVLLS